MTIPISVKNAFDPSDALDQHIERHVETIVRRHHRFVQRIDVRLSDVNGPRKGAADKLTVIEIALKPSGEIVARGESEDIYKSVTSASGRALEALRRHAGRLIRAEHRTEGDHELRCSNAGNPSQQHQACNHCRSRSASTGRSDHGDGGGHRLPDPVHK
jgi:ribosome-associated translation inhibitor RaiA